MQPFGSSFMSIEFIIFFFTGRELQACVRDLRALRGGGPQPRRRRRGQDHQADHGRLQQVHVDVQRCTASYRSQKCNM